MFTDRYQAGLALAKKLHSLSGKNSLVLAIPRGGVVIGKAVSEALGIPLDIVVVRKLRAPVQPELAIGAVGPEGILVFNEDLIRELEVEYEYVDREVQEQRKVISERLAKYRGKKREPELIGKTVILVDDGIATGATVEAAIKYLRTKKVKKLVLAVPIIARGSVGKFKKLADELINLETPREFGAVGEFYSSFPQVTDEEVIQLLR